MYFPHQVHTPKNAIYRIKPHGLMRNKWVLTNPNMMRLD